MRQETSELRVLDDLDLALLQELEKNSRAPVSELSKRVGAAESTCHKRIRALIDANIILGFRTELNLSALGLQIEALISIRINPHARNTLPKFQSFLASLPQVRQVYFMSGDRDFLVHVAVHDTKELRDLVSKNISIRSEVASTNTSIIFDHISHQKSIRI